MLRMGFYQRLQWLLSALAIFQKAKLSGSEYSAASISMPGDTLRLLASSWHWPTERAKIDERLSPVRGPWANCRSSRSSGCP